MADLESARSPGPPSPLLSDGPAVKRARVILGRMCAKKKLLLFSGSADMNGDDRQIARAVNDKCEFNFQSTNLYIPEITQKARLN